MIGYLKAFSASTYSYLSMVQHFGPLINAGGATLSLSYIASNTVIPGYGGGMSSAKAVWKRKIRKQKRKHAYIHKHMWIHKLCLCSI